MFKLIVYNFTYFFVPTLTMLLYMVASFTMYVVHTALYTISTSHGNFGYFGVEYSSPISIATQTIGHIFEQPVTFLILSHN